MVLITPRCSVKATRDLQLYHIMLWPTFGFLDELPPCPVFLEIVSGEIIALSKSLLPLRDCKFLLDLISAIDDDSGSAASNNSVAAPTSNK